MNTITVLPSPVIAVDGVPLDAGVLHAIDSVSVRQRLSTPAQCEIAFALNDESASSLGNLVPGSRLQVSISDDSSRIFDGEVTALEHVYGPAGGRRVLVRAYDLLHRLRKRQSVRVHVGVTAADLARELSADLGVTVQCAEDGPVWTRIVQHRQSDLELLDDVARRCGLYLTLRGDVLQLVTLEGLDEPIPLVVGDTLLEARIEINADAACSGVVATGWDPQRVESFEQEATSPRSGRSVDAQVAPGWLDDDGERHLSGRCVQGEPHLAALAQSELDTRVARDVSLWALAEGDAALRPGCVVSISGVDASVAGRYVITSVTHRIEPAAGFVTEISTLPPVDVPRTSSSVATIGSVVAVDDPASLGRVRLSLPAFAGVETEWLQVLSFGGGQGKGLTILPAVDDQVLVVLIEGEPDQGVILGGLYGMMGPIDAGIDGSDTTRFTLRTRSGQTLRLDDARRSIRVEDSTGSYFELSPDQVLLHAAVDLSLQAPGRRIVIGGASIDFERS